MNKNKVRRGYRWVVLLIVFTVYLIAGADRANIGIVAPFLKVEFGLTNADIGRTVTLFYIGYALVQIPGGFLYERFGIRRMMALFVVLTSAATLYVGFANSSSELMWSRLILGVAEGPIMAGILTVINRWFPPHEKGLAVGVYMSSIKLAPALVPPIGAIVISAFGWREVFFIFGIPGVLIALIWLFFLADDPAKSKFCSSPELDYIRNSNSPEKQAAVRELQRPRPMLDRFIRSREVELLATNRQILKSKNLLGCAVGYGLIAGISYGIMTWCPTYLIQVKGYALKQSGAIASVPWIGAIIGNIIGGILSDRVFEQRRKPLMLLTTASCVFTMYALIYAPANPFLLSAMLLVTGIFLNLGYSTFLVYPMGLVVKDKVPFAASLLIIIASVGGALIPYLIGVILDYANWNAVFTFMAFCSLMAFAATALIIEPVTRKVEAGTLPQS